MLCTMSFNPRFASGLTGDFTASPFFDITSTNVASDAAAPSSARASAVEMASVVHGLMQPRPTISPKYFYDERGSALFETITHLPEYYVTRVEQSIFLRHEESIAAAVGSHGVVIELGAGNCEKARGLCLRLQASEFIGLDISSEHLEEAAKRLAANMPWLRVRAIAADITEPIHLPDDVPQRNRTVFYPGSSIGNFEPEQAVQMLTQMRQLLGSESDGGGLLIGIDLPKPVHVLQAAYDDGAGVTAAFNRNALEHLNRRIGSDFVPEHWKHRAFFNSELSRVEMHLVAQRAMRVRWPGGAREFAMGDRIHTENSYKYSLDVFDGLLRHAGFSQSRHWTDEQGWFAVIHARP